MPFFRKKKKDAGAAMTLRGYPGDLGTAKCLIMAAEKKVKLETEVLDVSAGAQDQADYRGLSPFGKYPYMQEGDAVSVGAEAALAYMDTRGANFLNPKKAQLFGQQNYWWQIAEMVEPTVNSLCAGEAADTAVLDNALDNLDAALAKTRKCIVGEYSFADVHWTAIAHFLTLAGKQDMIDSRANVKTWFDAMKQRPSYAAAPTQDDMNQKQLRSVA